MSFCDNSEKYGNLKLQNFADHYFEVVAISVKALNFDLFIFSQV